MGMAEGHGAVGCEAENKTDVMLIAACTQSCSRWSTQPPPGLAGVTFLQEGPAGDVPSGRTRWLRDDNEKDLTFQAGFFCKTTK